MLVFKNTICVRMIFVPKGTGHMFIDQELAVYWLCDSQDSLQPFFVDHCSLRSEAGGLVCKVYGHVFLEFTDITLGSFELQE